MVSKKRMPEFVSETEEAKWLYEHRHELDDYMEAITEEGATEVKAELTKLKRSELISLRLPALDLTRAKALAEKKDMGYQTYLKSLIHDGLERDEQQQIQDVVLLLARDVARLRVVSKDLDPDLFNHLQLLASVAESLGINRDSRLPA